MSIHHQPLADDRVLVRVDGRIDHVQGPLLESILEGLLANGHEQLVIDLSGVTYVNSGGLRVLVSAWRSARRADGDVVLCGLTARVHEIVAMVGFDQVFTLLSDCPARPEAP